MLSLHHPAQAHGLTPMARPGRDASPHQIADYYHRMLVADGAIPPSSFSPFEPAQSDGAGFFYGRSAPYSLVSRSNNVADPFLPDAFSPSSSGDDVAERMQEGPLPLAFSQASDVASMMFSRGPAGPSEDDLIAAQLEEVRQVERELMASMHIPQEDDEELIRSQARLMIAAQEQRARGSSKPPYAEDLSKSTEVEELASTTAASTSSADAVFDMEMAQAASCASDPSSEECDPALQRALELSVTADTSSTASAVKTSSAEKQESAEAGMDIPFETPKSLLDDPAPDTAAPSSETTRAGAAAATTNKSMQVKSKRGKGKGSRA